MSRSCFLCRLGLLLPLLLLGASTATQGAGAGLEVRGSVLNPEGDPVPKATVAVTDDDSGFLVEATTDHKGRYSLQLPSRDRKYRFKISRMSYRTTLRTVRPEDLEAVTKGKLKQNFSLRYQKGIDQLTELDSGARARRGYSAAAVEAYNKGYRIRTAGDPKTARKYFDEALRLEPELPPANAAMAAIYLAEEKFQEALTAAEIVLRDQPNDSQALRIGYEASLALGEPKDAAEMLERIQDTDSGLGTAILLYNEGVVAFKSRNHALAAEKLEDAVEVAPEMSAAWEVLAKSHASAGNHAEAVAAALKVEELNPGDLEALAIHHDALTALGRHGDAEPLLDRLAEHDKSPQTAGRLYNAGVREHGAGDREAARRRFKQSLSVDPEFRLAWTGLATVCQEEGDHPAALEAAEKALELDSGDTAAARLREKALKALGKTSEGTEKATSADGATPSS